MCGIFGIITTEKSNYSRKEIKKFTDVLFRLSETRGKEASGLAVATGDKIRVIKKPIRANELIKIKDYKKLFLYNDKSIVLIGHARLVTNGKEDESKNNQPAIKNGIIAVHNGIVVNVNDLWRRFSDIKQETELDTEIILALLDKYMSQGLSIVESCREVYNNIRGTATISLLFNNVNALLLATNNGSLYQWHDKKIGISIFASEYYILKKFINRRFKSNIEIKHVNPGAGCLINLDSLEKIDFDLQKSISEYKEINTSKKERKIINLNSDSAKLSDHINIFNSQVNTKELEREYEKRKEKINKIKRCNRCILPETMPFIEFDKDGVCNYCNNYGKVEIFGREKLEKEISKYKNTNSRADCLIMFSGGRDSCYGLHLVKKELGLNPIAYSYDWGMLTDLGRRNQARLCGKLGVEHVIVSGDIRKKRSNIRKNVLAWLKKPELGTVPLFMAGDKQFFYHGYRLRKINELPFTLQCNNPYERTYFKYGFSGIDRFFKRNQKMGLTPLNRASIALYYLRQYVINPAYINSSLGDTIRAYLSYYFAPRDYISLFKYIHWREEEVNKVLINEYDWELATDTKTTWRIGDGTTAFYNYIYYMIAGFTENDTFRSNQIREGTMNRDRALYLAEEENKPRWESLRWYGDTINIDMSSAIKRINLSKIIF